MPRRNRLAISLTPALVGSMIVAAAAQDPPPPAQPPAGGAASKGAPKKGMMGAFPDLVKGLKETPGCLGVETAQTSSGKAVIFAWFKDKPAALAWYNSPMHRGAMGMMKGVVTPTSTPLKNVKDPSRPILVIASLTFAGPDRPKLEGMPMPIAQIAIEAYQPVDKGFGLGGHFAPESMETPEGKGEAPGKG